MKPVLVVAASPPQCNGYRCDPAQALRAHITPSLSAEFSFTASHRALLYLSGYSNTAKNAFLRLVRNCNQDKEWLHFGDIDPDGFYILENLRNKTDIDFQPFYMGIGELKKYMRFTKPLERNDVRKAESLKKSRYSDVVRFMLDHNCKLEQEIISWKDHV